MKRKVNSFLYKTTTIKSIRLYYYYYYKHIFVTGNNNYNHILINITFKILRKKVKNKRK
jgi:hypothetical protein